MSSLATAGVCLVKTETGDPSGIKPSLASTVVCSLVGVGDWPDSVGRGEGGWVSGDELGGGGWLDSLGAFDVVG